MRKFLTTLLVLLLAGSAAVMAQSPKREFRSVWLTTYSYIDWPADPGTSASDRSKQQTQLVEYIENHKKRNFTTILFHVRTRADAVYESSYEPWSQYVSGTRGKSPGWDPLAFAVEECHKRGLECYAWVNPFRFRANSKQPCNTEYDKELRDKGWLIGNASGYETFDPGIPEVREHLLKVIKEIYTKYRIDGMLFDDYFYPNKIPENNTADDWDTYQKYGDGMNIGDWRRNNINTFMCELADQIHAARPDLCFGLSPAGIAHNGSNFDGCPPFVPGTTDWQYDDIYSDPVAWLHDGCIDFISPQLYWFSKPGNNSYTTAAPYEKLVEWWYAVAKHFGRHVYMSLGPYRFADSKGNPIYNNEAHWADLDHQIKTLRSVCGATGGQAYFSGKYMDGPLCKGWGDYLSEHDYQLKALVPKRTWYERPEISAPDAVRKDNTISWTAADQTGNAPIMRYTVYAVPANISQRIASGSDGILPGYLLDVVYGSSYTIPADRRSGYWYAVCAYDGYGFESEPTLIDYVPPVVDAVSTDPASYAEFAGMGLTNCWYRSVKEGFSPVDFTDNGNGNRGLAIAGNSVFMTDRSDNTADATARIFEYDLVSGELLAIHMPQLPAVAYKCNDIVADNKGRLYISNLVLDARSNPVQLYRFDPATGETTEAASITLGQKLARTRVDHVSVDAPSDNVLHVYAAMAGGKEVVRWTVEDGQVKNEEVMTAGAFYPESIKNFGISPRAVCVGEGRVMVNGGSVHPTEYDFATGKVVSSFANCATEAPVGFQANGIAHFGCGKDCFFAFPVNDTEQPDGFAFGVFHSDNHGLGASTRRAWTFPKGGMGTARPQYVTGSAPVASATVESDDNTYHYVAVLAPGNGLAVYKITMKGSGIDSTVGAEVAFSIHGRSLLLDEAADVRVLNMAGMEIASARATGSMELPGNGMYILVINGKAHRVAVR